MDDRPVVVLGARDSNTPESACNQRVTFSVGPERFELQIETQITRLRRKPAEVMTIDRARARYHGEVSPQIEQ